jgi:hypothetical protein
MRIALTLGSSIFILATGCAGQNHHFVRDAYVKELGCPESKVIVLNYLGNDKRRGNEWQAYGCGQRRTCLDNNEKAKWECRWPDDLQAAAAQLQLLTNCPTVQMKPVAYNEAKKGPDLDDNGGDWDWPGGSWRIDTCGKPYMCQVNEANQATCQPAPDLTSAPPPMPVPVPPPPPPSR